MGADKIDPEKLSVFEQIRLGLEESIESARGELTLRTTVLPAPAPELSKSRVVSIRRRLGMSQAVFARYLNVPTRTLQSWEQGARTPKAGEARLLQIIEASPAETIELIESAKPRPGKADKRLGNVSRASSSGRERKLRRGSSSGSVRRGK